MAIIISFLVMHRQRTEIRQNHAAILEDQRKEQVNSELVGAWGNFVNRTLAFVAKYLGNALPHTDITPALREQTRENYESVGERIEHGAWKEAIKIVFD